MTETTAPPPKSGSGDDVTGRLEGVSKARVFSVLAILVLFSEVVPLQYTIVSAGIPQIAKTFPHAETTWMIVILGLVGGAVSPLIGKMADLYGKKKMLLACSASFLVGTVICAITTSWAIFLVGRGLEAVAFGMTAIVYGMIRDLMPRKFVPVAIGVSATGLGLSAAIAPILGGVLTDHFSWRSLFWFLAIYMIVSVPLCLLWVPESKLRVKQKLDFVGAIVLGLGLAGILLYLSEGQDWGWGTPTAWAYAVGGVVLIALWVVWEKNQSDPLIDLKLLTAPRVATLLVIGFMANVIIGIQNYLVTYMAQTPKSADLKHQIDLGTASGIAEMKGLPAQAVPQLVPVAHGMTHYNGSLTYAMGFSMLAMALHLSLWQSVTSMFAGPLAGAAGQKMGLRKPMIAGMFLLSLGMTLYMLFHNSWQAMLIVGMIYGIGFGIYYAAAPNLMIEATPQEQQGISSGMLVVAQSFGSAVGTAMLAPVFTKNGLVADIMGHKTTIPQVFTEHMYVIGFGIALVAGVIGLVFAIFMKSGRTPATGGLLQEAEAAGANPAIIEAAQV